MMEVHHEPKSKLHLPRKLIIVLGIPWLCCAFFCSMALLCVPLDRIFICLAGYGLKVEEIENMGFYS
jgi:hypothetical protein